MIFSTNNSSYNNNKLLAQVKIRTNDRPPNKKKRKKTHETTFFPRNKRWTKVKTQNTYLDECLLLAVRINNLSIFNHETQLWMCVSFTVYFRFEKWLNFDMRNLFDTFENRNIWMFVCANILIYGPIFNIFLILLINEFVFSEWVCFTVRN